MTGTFAGEPFWLGSHRYLVERNQDAPDIARKAEALERDGRTVVAIGNIPPAEAEARYYAQPDELAMVA